MFRKQDFKKLDLLGSGKKHTKIYKVQHIPTNKIYALKEIEAKTLDKLNEYKEEAVQLSKVQNLGNVIKFHGYYFAETMYNTYRLGIITEYMDHNTNLESVYRKRKKSNLHWKEHELLAMLFSMISTCSYLQQKGICHRDIKPANLFILSNGELKLIDFGESKDYFYDPNDENKNTYTMATIRGTPQYLSPTLWKAHVIDGNSRYVEHNIYKSDVFSTGLVIYQMAAMQEVTGFNNKTPQTDGEQVVKQSLIQLEKLYGNQFINVIALMLIFEECNRPSYVEVEQLFIEHEKQASEGIQRIKLNEYIQLYNIHYNTLLKKGTPFRSQSESEISFRNILQQYFQNQQNPGQLSQTTEVIRINKDSNSGIYDSGLESAMKLQGIQIQNYQENQNNLNNTKKNKNATMYRDSTLILNDSCYFFEFGGTNVAKFSINKLKWKHILKLDHKLGYHFYTLFAPDTRALYLVGGESGSNFKTFVEGKLSPMRAQIPGNRFFAATLYYNRRLYFFGGYDGTHKIQLSSCLMYDVLQEKWSQIAEMKNARSQASVCRINDQEVIVCGGYSKVSGLMNSIERYSFADNKWSTSKLCLPIPLRRFVIVRIKQNIALIMGGLTSNLRESQRVFKIEWSIQKITEQEPLEKGGVIESEVLVDSDGYFHLFLENANGTSQFSHIKYQFDIDANEYITTSEI